MRQTARATGTFHAAQVSLKARIALHGKIDDHDGDVAQKRREKHDASEPAPGLKISCRALRSQLRTVPQIRARNLTLEFRRIPVLQQQMQRVHRPRQRVPPRRQSSNCTRRHTSNCTRRRTPQTLLKNPTARVWVRLLLPLRNKTRALEAANKDCYHALVFPSVARTTFGLTASFSGNIIKIVWSRNSLGLTISRQSPASYSVWSS